MVPSGQPSSPWVAWENTRLVPFPQTDWVLIHQMGKVGSQTMEHSIRLSDPSIRVERHHELHPRSLKSSAMHLSLPGVPRETADSLRAQLAAARRCTRELLLRKEKIRLCVISGYRDPISYLLASLFQNLRAVVPDLE